MPDVSIVVRKIDVTGSSFDVVASDKGLEVRYPDASLGLKWEGVKKKGVYRAVRKMVRLLRGDREHREAENA